MLSSSVPRGGRFAAACCKAGIRFVAALAYPGGLGMGDVKLYALIALALGWLNPLLVPVVWLLAAVTGVVEIGWRAVARRSLQLTGSIALGPHLLLATIVLTIAHFAVG